MSQYGYIYFMWDHLHSILNTSAHCSRYQDLLYEGGADKSLARSGRKQATATKLEIYSTYSP